MASYHCTLKSDSNKSGSAHSDYINREGKYAAIENNRDKYAKYEDLVYKSSGNMPEWARENPKDFWKAADEFERANGRSYTEIEIALPNELTREQQIELVASRSDIAENIILFIRKTLLQTLSQRLDDCCSRTGSIDKICFPDMISVQRDKGSNHGIKYRHRHLAAHAQIAGFLSYLAQNRGATLGCGHFADVGFEVGHAFNIVLPLC